MASSPSAEQYTTAPNADKMACVHCSKVFETRNALFRHIRTDSECSIKSATGGQIELVKTSIAFQFGYTDFIDTETNDLNHAEASKAAQAGTKIQLLLIEKLKKMAQTVFNNEDATCKIEILGTTQSSLAKLRHRSLSQESSCAAEGDVLFINVLVPKLMNLDLWSQIGKSIRKRLLEENPNFELFALQVLGAEHKLHAERSATQYIYHYMLPLSWLPDAEAFYDWWSLTEALPNGPNGHHQHTGRKLASKTPQSLRTLKEALRIAECNKLSAEVIRADTSNKLKVAAGRFGALGAMEKRAWHNFADPSLKGDASPSNEPVWRVVDRARVVDFVELQNKERTAVIEIRGDGFIKEQIRRIVGTAVAMTRGWLPLNFFDLATDCEKLVGTPIAPPNRLYLSSVRYHFDEMQSDGLPFFQPHESRDLIDLCPVETRRNWAKRAVCHHTSTNAAEAELEWLRTLEDDVAPSIRNELASQRDEILAEKAATCPEYYEPVLSELRRISSSGLWPETSIARATVIRSQDKENSAADGPLKNGSFTIVNPNIAQKWDSLPLGNTLFPDLVSAVFGLEASLSQNQKATRITVDDSAHNVTIADRPASSQCAVNCNAQFTPHVDSGRGSGQKLSMIVGLGDYSGGHLRVEGDSLDIQYNPLVFDGWKLRHWTNLFAGERFSLVWFTPEANT